MRVFAQGGRHTRPGKLSILLLSVALVAPLLPDADARLTDPPADAFTYSPGTPRSQQTITFTSTSTDGVPILLYAWDFGDGNLTGFTRAASQTHAYAHPGE